MVGIQLFLVPGRGLRAHTQRLGGAAHAGAVKAGGLKYDGGGVVHNTAVFAAHYAGNGHRLLRIGNHQHILRQLPGLAVQGGDGLAGLGVTHIHCVAHQVTQVKGVHGLAVLQHHIVGNIYNVADGAHATGTQSLPQPAG